MLEYLAAHEVAHLVEMNHSARFWRVVQRICPDHERAKVGSTSMAPTAPLRVAPARGRCRLPVR